MQDKIKDYFNEDHLNELGISVYLNALINDDTNSLEPSLLEHVEECKLCKTSILENYKLFKSFNSENEEIIKPEHNRTKDLQVVKKQKRKVLYNFIKVAAVITIVIGLGHLINLLSDKNVVTTEELVKNNSIKSDNQIKENESEIKNGDSIINENIILEKELNSKAQKTNTDNIETNKLLASNFKESANLENFININVRSVENLNIISPEVSKVFGQNNHIVFKWQTTINEPLILKILTNKEIVIKKIESVISGEYTLTEPLEPGLYYWKIETVDDLYYTGKFYIK